MTTEGMNTQTIIAIVIIFVVFGSLLALFVVTQIRQTKELNDYYERKEKELKEQLEGLINNSECDMNTAFRRIDAELDSLGELAKQIRQKIAEEKKAAQRGRQAEETK